MEKEKGVPPLLAAQGYVDEAEMAHLLGMKRPTLATMRKTNPDLPHVNNMRTPYYLPDRVLAWKERASLLAANAKAHRPATNKGGRPRRKPAQVDTTREGAQA